MLSFKQTEGEISLDKAVGTTIPIVYHKGLFNIYENADEELKEYLLIEVNEKRRPDLDPMKDVVTKW